jgi:hypothetical protein
MSIFGFFTRAVPKKLTKVDQWTDAFPDLKQYAITDDDLPEVAYIPIFIQSIQIGDQRGYNDLIEGFKLKAG